MINHLPAQKNLPIQKNWQTQLTEAVTSVDELLSLLDIQPDPDAQWLRHVPKQFALRVPRGYIAKMRQGDSGDPLLRQVLPDRQEMQQVTGFVADPLAEQQYNPMTGLLHKYRSRVLLTVTGACAVHCRYCFRQHFDYAANMPSTTQHSEIAAYIQAHPDINEVILSGGDPLSVSNRRLFAWLDILENIKQVQTIRIHTRLPLMIPDRVDEALCQRLSASRCRLVMVVHCNHGNELDEHSQRCFTMLRQADVTLLNQAVLLSGINDTLAAQVNLSQRLFQYGVLPYYLHLLDKVAGAAHFEVAEDKAVALYWRLLAELPGYLVPKLVRELPEYAFKSPTDIYKPERTPANMLNE